MIDYSEYRGSVLENEKRLWNKGSISTLEFDYIKILSYKKEILKNLILRNISTKNTLKILDIETGKGFFAMIMAEEGHDVTAIDSTAHIVNEVKVNSSKYKMKIDFRIMDKNTLDFRDKTFDLIISSNITWDLQSPKSAFTEWKRVLKDDGTLVYFDSNWNLDLSKANRPSLDKSILNKCGFKSVEIDENVYKMIFSEEGILPYKPKSVFMVVAKK